MCRAVPGRGGVLPMGFAKAWALVGALLVVAAFAPPAGAQETVKIGAIYPLSGNAASAGESIRAALEVGLDVINNAHPDLGGLPLAATAGLSNLGGARLEIVFADNQGSPAA